MKTYNKELFFALLFISCSVVFMGCAKDDVDESLLVVSIPDAALSGAIKTALGLESDASVTRDKLAELTELDAQSMGITEVAVLTGLEYAVNLIHLNLGGNQVTDISPIAGLKKIEYLRFNDTPLADLSPIAGYTSLTYFNANTAVNITDISPLAGNTGLQQLILRNVPMGDAGMDVISNFKKIYRLNMRNTGVTDITVLGELMAQGAFLKTTPGAAEAGADAEIDLRQNDIVSYDPIRSYVENGTAVTTNPSTLPEN